MSTRIQAQKVIAGALVFSFQHRVALAKANAIPAFVILIAGAAPYMPSLAWQMSKSHQALVVITVGLFPILLAILLLVPAVMLLNLVSLPPLLIAAVASIAQVVMLVLSIAALSMTYREIERVEHQEHSDT